MIKKQIRHRCQSSSLHSVFQRRQIKLILSFSSFRVFILSSSRLLRAQTCELLFSSFSRGSSNSWDCIAEDLYLLVSLEDFRRLSCHTSSQFNRKRYCFGIYCHRNSFVLDYAHWKSEERICAELAYSTDADVLEIIVVFCVQQGCPAYVRDSLIICRLNEKYQSACVQRNEFSVHFRI